MRYQLDVSKKRLAILIFVIIISAISIKLVADWANSPTIQTVSTSTPSVTTDEPVADKVISTDFFTTKISGNYNVQKALNNSNANLVQISAFKSEDTNTQIGITSNILPSEGLVGVADYNYRVKRTDVYEPVVIDGLKDNAAAFKTHSAGEEVTIFLVNGSRYASLVATSASSEFGDLIKIVSQLTDSWTWL